jgi:hypothetical protein
MVMKSELACDPIQRMRVARMGKSSRPGQIKFGKKWKTKKTAPGTEPGGPEITPYNAPCVLS